jgi:choline dehydrogenase-like flavoprotein
LSIHDLAKGAAGREIHCDVCVVGAGPVGLTLARALADKGRDVVVLDAGPSTPTTERLDSGVRFDRLAYKGATEGRAFGLGGTSSLWGGQLLPVRDTDLCARSQIGAPEWPIAYAELERHFGQLQRWLHVGQSAFDLGSVKASDSPHPLAQLSWLDWAPRRSQWMSFDRRNLAKAWRRELAAARGIVIWLNAHAGGWHFNAPPGPRVLEGVEARSANGHILKLRPRVVAVCAGGLESARAVLEMNLQSGGLSPGVDQFSGRYLHDHLSMRIARIEVLDRTRLQQLFAPRFEGATMRSLRMELSPDFLAREHLPALYAHIIAVAPADSAFAVVRDMLRALQRGQMYAAIRDAARMPKALPGIADLLYWRYLRNRLAFPSDSTLYLSVDFEQAPQRENRIYLGESGPDGRRRLHIDWDIPSDAPRIGKAVQKAFQAFWIENQLEKVARLDFIDLETPDVNWVSNLYGLYHPAGTTQMARDPEFGVVDADLRIHGTRNAFVAGSSVFPSMGAANPTFTAMALALRLAEFIDRGTLLAKT